MGAGAAAAVAARWCGCSGGTPCPRDGQAHALARNRSIALTLYYHPLSSFCWKALVALYEADIAFEARQVDLRDPVDRAAFEALWPLAKFPVLRDDARGKTVPESSIIID